MGISYARVKQPLKPTLHAFTTGDANNTPLIVKLFNLSL
jgi:hypothetical protein